MDLSKFKGSQKRQELTFEKFPCAIFGRQYQLADAVESSTITGFASYYLTLPAVSNSLYGVALRSPSFATALLKNPCLLFAPAKIMRNDLLFKDSLTLSLGPWSKSVYLNLPDPELLKLASAA
jgi:hypothetical protein